ncbi:DUF1272 domain-containing protein [Mycobacteroides stephanolepidis]|nr:DUF1272 domain-containing protein [[Mycobacterium] stephanolepidis]
MKPACQRCQVELGHTDSAWICSYECTYCAECKPSLPVCPNCKGELTPRPRRALAPTSDG